MTQIATSSATSSLTAGATLRRSPALRAAIDAIVAESNRAAATITDIRPSRADLSESYEALMKRCADVRGRALLYPYLGSGLGNGALVELADGSVKWDMICGIGVHFFGHSNPELVRVSAESSVDNVLKHGNLSSNMEAYEFGETLLQLASRKSKLKHVYVATSGAMANENALKVCYQKHAPASRVLCFQDCFMGRSITMCQIGDGPDYRQGIPLSTLVDYMPFWDPAAADAMGPGGKKRFIDMAVKHLEQYIHRYPGQHACFIFELCQGEGGFKIGDRDFLKALIDVCKAHRIAVWDDEIQTFGRLPSMFAYEHFDLGEYVDVFCVGKMTQACATMYTEEYNPKAGLLSGTFTGEGVSFRTGTRILEMLRDGDFYGPQGKFEKHHAAFRTHSKALIDKHPEWFPSVAAMGGGGEKLAGGAGGMMRLTPFGGDKAKITAACKACFEEGVILFYCGHSPYHLRMLPPLPVMKESDWPRVFECIERGLAKVK
jgi:4-aminobutyrate aminotransferase-like enzyme